MPLRRSDWRLLAGSASFGSVAYRCDEGLLASAARISDAVTPLADGITDIDQCVLSDPSPADLRMAHAALVPGGGCYVEWRRPRVGGLRRALRMLRAAGFVAVECYWAWPPPTTAATQIWLPLKGRASERHMRSRSGHGPKRRSATWIRDTAWRVARRTGFLAPLVAVAWKPPVDNRESLVCQIRRRWESWGLGRQPASLSCVLLTGGRDDLNKLVTLAYPDGANTAALAVKVARGRDAEHSLRVEYGTLTALDDRQRSPFDIPEALFCERLAGALAVGETPIDGTPVGTLLNRATHSRLVLRVAEQLRSWVVDAEPVPRNEWWDRLVDPTIAGFSERFGADIPVEALNRHTDRLCSLESLPLVPEHRDCSPWNVLVRPDGRLALLDWESSEPKGLPGLDLCYFLANASFVVERTLGSGTEPTSYNSALDVRTRMGRAQAAAIHRYCAGTGLNADAIAALRALAWMIHACAEYDRGARAPGTPSPPSVYFSLWLADTGMWTGDLSNPRRAR